MLNMRSTSRRAAWSDDDLTTRARIRDAAVLRFGADGFRASVRAVATDAGVSPGLVIHHYGSKDKLREACDEHVLREIRRAKLDALVEGPAGRFLEYLATAEQFAPVFAYVMRSLQHGGVLAKTFVDHMVDDTVEYLAAGVEAGVIRPSRDEQARARYLVLGSLGAGLLSLTLEPSGEPGDVAATMRRYYEANALPALEVFTEGLLTTRRMLDAYLLYVGDPPAERDAHAS